MTLPEIDRDGLATIEAAEGQSALAVGDTLRARKKYGEAGDRLKERIASARKQTEKHFFRFLAASQYYRGGHYRKALELCQRIDPTLLPPEVGHLFPKFFLDVRSRSASDYEGRIRRELVQLRSKKDYSHILEKLQEHPYILKPGEMAFFRAVACENLGNLRAAAAFYGDTLRLNPENVGMVFAAVALPLTLPGQGKLEEAWDYVCLLLDAVPHPSTDLVASILCFNRASEASSEEDRRRLFEEQLGYFEKARQAFGTIPTVQRSSQEMRYLMDLGFDSAAMALLRIGDNVRARAICDDAISFQPNSASAWANRGITRYPEPGSVEDFKKAVDLGDDSYVPYYYLAHNALTKDDFPSALSLCQLALQKPKRPGNRIEAQLHSWIGICRHHLGADRQEVETSFQKALTIDPGNEEVRHNYELFLDSVKTTAPRVAPKWDPGSTNRMDVFPRLSDRQALLAEAFRHTRPVQYELEKVGT